MNLASLKHIYFIGIGGIGMSALARLFRFQGKLVSGYDRTQTPLTDTLISEGIPVHYDDDPGKIPADTDLVVYTPAIPDDHQGLAHVRKHGLPLMKRAEVLGLLSENHFTVAVAGTHGKTSISSMLSHICAASRHSVTGLVGGIMRNYDSNLVIMEGGDYLIAEADEYDRSFHQLHPGIALISAIDADHLDIYGNHEQIVRDFESFASRLPAGGTLLLHDTVSWDAPGNYHVMRYGREGQFRISDMQIGTGKVHLCFELDGKATPYFDFFIPGRHNIDNALGAAALAILMGLGTKDIISGLASYKGVLRRFEIRYTSPERVYIDDYAHHPRELEATIRAIREFYPGKRITGVFQPHLYTRTRDFAAGFAASLDLLDDAYLMEVYPARELPIPGVGSAMIAKLMDRPAGILKPEGVLGIAKEFREGVFVTLGAGDIDKMVSPLTNVFESAEEGRPV